MSSVYQITHEAGDFSEYSGSNGTAITIDTPGLGNSTYCAELAANAASSIPYKDRTYSSITGTIFRFGWLIARDDLTPATSASGVAQFWENNDLFNLQLIISGGTVEIRAICSHAGGPTNIQSADVGSDEISVELRIEQASADMTADGSFRLFVDGLQVAQAANVDNHTEFEAARTASATQNRLAAPNYFGGSGDQSGSMRVDLCTFRNDDTPIFPPPATGNYALSIMPAREAAGYAWATIWLDDHLELRRLNLSTKLFDRIYNLGDATLEEIQARTKGAWVWALTDEIVFVFGNMAAPGQLAGTQHIIFLNEGTDFNFDSVESGWGSDICAALHVGFPSGSSRQYFAVRESASAAPKFYYGTDDLASNVSLPFASGATIPHRGLAYNLPHAQVAIVALQAADSVVVARASSPFTTWVDISDDYPAPMTGRVVSYLAGNG